MSTTPKSAGVSAIGAAVIVMICVLLTVVCVAVVSAQAHVPSPVHPHVAALALLSRSA